MKKLKLIFYLALGVLFPSCTAQYGGAKLEKQGIYECKSKTIKDAPIYRFDSYSDSTKLILGAVTYLEIYDINSNQIVRLYEDNYNYLCECIKEY